MSGNPVSTTLRSVHSDSRMVGMVDVVRASGQFDKCYMSEYQLFVGTNLNIEILKRFVASGDVSKRAFVLNSVNEKLFKN